MADASTTEARFDVETPESGFVPKLGWLFTHQADPAHEFVSERAENERARA